jgi:hypothetical protein
MAKSFGALYKFGLPARFRTGEGALVQATIALLLDYSLTRIRYGLEARFPSKAGDSALAMTGADRAVLRGRTETSAHYAQRLIRWRYPRGHRTRGSAWAALEQISEYFGALACWSIDINKNRYDYAADGTTAYTPPPPVPIWNWDNTDTPVYRFWVVLMGGAGFTFTSDDVVALRSLFGAPTPWKPAGTRAEWAIVSTDGTEPSPDGTWLHWSQNIAGVQTPTRPTSFLFWSLAIPYNNTYAGVLLFPTSYPIDSGFYTPSATWHDTITLSDGVTTYAGNAQNYPASFRLLDDGDVVA